MGAELDCTIDETTFAAASPGEYGAGALPSGSWGNLMFLKVEKLSLSVMYIVCNLELTAIDTNYILSLRDGLPMV